MHELGIVFHTIRTIEEVAAEQGLTRVGSVTLELGEVSGAIPLELVSCWDWAVNRTELLAKTAAALKANNLKDAPARAEALNAELKETTKQLEILKAQVASAKIDGLFENAADIDGVRIVSAYLTGTGADTLRDMVDKIRDKAPNAVTVLIGSDGAKTMMAVGVSKNALARGLKAGALVKKIAAIAGGNGGGKPDFAMAGIRDASKIDDALNAVPEIVKAEMNQ